jgi:hypothetical protein
MLAADAHTSNADQNGVLGCASVIGAPQSSSQPSEGGRQPSRRSADRTFPDIGPAYVDRRRRYAGRADCRREPVASRERSGAHYGCTRTDEAVPGLPAPSVDLGYELPVVRKAIRDSRPSTRRPLLAGAQRGLPVGHWGRPSGHRRRAGPGVTSGSRSRTRPWQVERGRDPKCSNDHSHSRAFASAVADAGRVGDTGERSRQRDCEEIGWCSHPPPRIRAPPGPTWSLACVAGRKPT